MSSPETPGRFKKEYVSLKRQGSRPKGRDGSGGILRLDMTRSRLGSPNELGPIEPPSPQPSVDRLSVTFATEERSVCSSDTSVKVNLYIPETPKASCMEKVRFPTITDGEDSEEDYSASVTAIMNRRASTRKSRRKSRRTSSPFSHEDGIHSASRRRSSVFTTSSGDTAISLEESLPQEVTQEQIFENIRLHKEVLGSVKMQPWGMRRKIKLVQQAKSYIKRHEGVLQERLAQSRSTRDMLARWNIVLIQKWQHYKREMANLSNWLIPWESRIKEIESHFGSVVASYFTFLRWLFWVNLIISVVIVCFIAVPQMLNANPQAKEFIRNDPKATNLLTLWDFEGALKYSPLFYGYYTNRDEKVYRLPFAYFMTGLGVYAYSFVATLRKMAANYRMSKLSEKDDECVFSWKLFTGWDYMIGNAETAHNRVASIILSFKEALLEEAEKKRQPRDWKIISIRVLVNFFVIVLLGASAWAVVEVVQRSTEPEAKKTLWRRNEITVVMSLISLIFPNFFELLGFLERYHPRKQLRLQLARIMVLNLLNLYSLIFALFDKISDMTKELQDLKPLQNTTNALSSPTMWDSVISASNLFPAEEPCLEVLLNCSNFSFPELTSASVILALASNISIVVAPNFVKPNENSSTTIIDLVNSYTTEGELTTLNLNWTTISHTAKVDNNSIPLQLNDFVLDQDDNSTKYIINSSAVNSNPLNQNNSMTYPDIAPENLIWENSRSTNGSSEEKVLLSTEGNEYNTTTEKEYYYSDYYDNYTLNDSSYSNYYTDYYENDYNKSTPMVVRFDDYDSNDTTSMSSKSTESNSPNETVDYFDYTTVSDINIDDILLNKTYNGTLDLNSSDYLNTTDENSTFYTESNNITSFNDSSDLESTTWDTSVDYINYTLPTDFNISDSSMEVSEFTENNTADSSSTADNLIASSTSDPSLFSSTEDTRSTVDTINTSSDATPTLTSVFDSQSTAVVTPETTCGSIPHMGNVRSMGCVRFKCRTEEKSEVTTQMSKEENITRQNRLKSLCWETMFGQELVKLTVMDLLFTTMSTLTMDFFRALFVRLMNHCWCWDLEKQFPQYGDFKIAENILHLVNNQGMVWMGMFFSPGLSLINLAKLMVIMYLRSWAVMTCNVPHEVVFRASRSNNFYLALLLTMLFLCVLPVGYAIVWVEPSWHCGPFSNYHRIYHIFTQSLQKALPKRMHRALDYIASPGIVIPLLVLLVLIIYYLISLTNSLREANNDLKFQLRRERTEERKKMFQIADRRRRNGSGDSGDMENTPFGKWKKLLPMLPNTKSFDGEVSKENDKESKPENKNKDFLAKFIKRALRKPTDEQPQAADDGTDTEHHESLPDDNVKEPEALKKGESVLKRAIALAKKQAPVDRPVEAELIIAEKTTESVKKTITKIKDVKRRKDDSRSMSKSSSSKEIRQDSISSVWSDNIPVITISKTESSECILENQNGTSCKTQTKRNKKIIHQEHIDVENKLDDNSASDLQIAEPQCPTSSSETLVTVKMDDEELDVQIQYEDEDNRYLRKEKNANSKEKKEKSLETVHSVELQKSSSDSTQTSRTRTESSSDYKE